MVRLKYNFFRFNDQSEAFIPGVGWVISGVYFISNTIIKDNTGKSIGDYIRTGIENYRPPTLYPMQ
jgi:hypothetical protein